MRPKTRQLLIAAIILISIKLEAQDTKDQVTLTGTVTNGETGERLSGASLLLSDGHGVISNQYGFFSISASRATAKVISVSYLGFSSKSFSYKFDRDSVLAIALYPNPVVLKDIEIGLDHSNERSFEDGILRLSPDKVKSMASFGAEPDLFKTLQLFPGVQSGNEGTTNISVRGGSHDQNLVLLDEAPVYNPSHALSFFSIFNIDALQSVDFYKSEIPVRYGGRLSSVVDVRMKEGNKFTRQTSGAIGTIASRITTEGPLFKNGKWSYIASGRYSYAGHLVNAVYFLGQRFFGDPTANRSTTSNKINFYDLNGKVNFKANDRNHFYFSVYSGHDKFYLNHITSGYDLSWGNTTSTLRWNHIHSKKLFSNSTLIFSNYNYEYRLLNNTQYFLWSAGLQEQQIKQDYDLYLTPNNYVAFGFGFQYHVLNPGRIAPRDDSSVSGFFELSDKRALGSNLYVSNTRSIFPTLTLTYGVRYSNFGLTGKRIQYEYNDASDDPTDSTSVSSIKLFHRFDPRVVMKLNSGKAKYALSYDRTTQFFHLLANSSVGLPTDIWWPSSNNIKPMYADIVALNFERDMLLSWTLRTAVFYKSVANAVDFKDNARLFVNKHVESQIVQGNAKAYGLEIFLEKNLGKLTGSLSYTISKSFNKIPGVNNGESYPTRYDKRHNVSSTWKYPLSPRLGFSTNFVLTTGGALTVPAGTFVYDGIPFSYYNERNDYRLPVYHRLDVSLKYSRPPKVKKTARSYWALDIYNVYGRKNPFTIYAIQSDYGFFNAKMHAFYLYRIVPSISYNFTF